MVDRLQQQADGHTSSGSSPEVSGRSSPSSSRCPYHRSVGVCVHARVYVCMCGCVHAASLYVCVCVLCLSVCESVSVCLSICQSVSLTVCLSVCRVCVFVVKWLLFLPLLDRLHRRALRLLHTRAPDLHCEEIAHRLQTKNPSRTPMSRHINKVRK